MNGDTCTGRALRADVRPWKETAEEHAAAHRNVEEARATVNIVRHWILEGGDRAAPGERKVWQQRRWPPPERATVCNGHAAAIQDMGRGWVETAALALEMEVETLVPGPTYSHVGPRQ